MKLRNASLALGLVTLGLSTWVLLPMGTASAEASYDAVARTDVSTVTIANQSIPTGIDIEGGGPSVSVRQDSVGISDANAQLPYVGNTVPGLPGVGAGLFGFEAPPYPFLAASTAGSKPQSVTYPGVSLNAESGDFTTSASSIAGEPGSGASATARIDEQRLGDVIASAATAVDSIKLGPYGTLSNVKTEATVRANGTTGTITRTATSSIGRISVPGLTFTVPKESPSAIPIPIPIPGVPNQPPIPAPPFPFPAGGQTFFGPDLGIQDGFFVVTSPDGAQQKYAVPAGPVLEALAAQGIKLRFQAPQETATGIVAGAYIVEYTIPAPPQNPVYTGDTTITQTTAYALASVNLQPTVITDPVLGAPGTDPGAAPGVTDGVGVDSVGVDSVGADLGVIPSTSGVPTVGLTPAGGLTGGEQTVSLAGFKVGLGVDNLYLSVAGLALAGLVAAAAVSWLGVRSR